MSFDEIFDLTAGVYFHFLYYTEYNLHTFLKHFPRIFIHVVCAN